MSGEGGTVVSCSHDGCTFVDTQVCARTGSSSPCEFAAWSEDEEKFVEDTEAEERPTAQPTPLAKAHPPPDDLGFHVGQELGEEDLNAILGEDTYGRVIAVFGDALAGKTSLLITFYMLLAAGELEDEGLTFAGSLTLPGFETRCRHTRVWVKGHAPAAMTARTLIGSARGGGFLHLDVAHDQSDRKSRLLMSDLPGEWTRDLILQARHGDRLGFAHRSDALLLVIDGQQLVGGDRWAVQEDQKLLIDRLADHLGSSRPPLALVATRRDIIGEDEPAVLGQLRSHAESRGFTASTFVICTFASDANTPSGIGVSDVLRFCLGAPAGVTAATPALPRAGRLFGWAPVMAGGGLP